MSWAEGDRIEDGDYVKTPNGRLGSKVAVSSGQSFELKCLNCGRTISGPSDWKHLTYCVVSDTSFGGSA